VRVINLSMDSALDAEIFEKRSWHSLIGLRTHATRKMPA
jgi:hypothetical protein